MHRLLVLPRARLPLSSLRRLNLHEYQSKELMTKYQVAVQKFKTAETAQQAESFAKQLRQ